MKARSDKSWTKFAPAVGSASSWRELVACARELSRLPPAEETDEAVDRVRASFTDAVRLSARPDGQRLLAAGLILIDLYMQGWQLRVRKDEISIRPQEAATEDLGAEKARIRKQELVKRNAQLREPAVQKFVRSMEAGRLFNGRFTSIFSLMRDGRELAEALRAARVHSNNGWAEALANVVDPYLQFVGSPDATCTFTGLRLADIWRYFRHTWTNQYTSVPGRTMAFLVRDGAASSHPVIGIGAVSSPIMQIRERDMWIGWHPDAFLAEIKARPTEETAKWLIASNDSAIAEIYLEDLLEDRVLSLKEIGAPSKATVEKLLNEAAEQRRLHHRYVRSQDHKVARGLDASSEHWIKRARTHLFRSKRALGLATYLDARAVLQRSFGEGASASALTAMAETKAGADAVRKILRKAKADRVGISVADITVCGAVQPYNAILGGKLVAMLATSAEVVHEYRRRYASAESEIASSMAGRPIVRNPTLVMLGTTSLYGVGSSQYNRISIPCDRVDGPRDQKINYQELGHSEAFGTSQYGEDTVEALVTLVEQSEDGQRVNSIFGEGVSPKLRKVRQGLDLLKLPTDLLLKHHRRRVVYGISLVSNLRRFLLGIDLEPQYFMKLENSKKATAAIASWWRERWLRKRIESDEVLASAAHNTLVRPIRHGARVTALQEDERQLPFAESF